MALHTIVEHDTTHIKPYIDKVKQALSNEAKARAELGAHNLFDGYFRNGLITVNENYTNRAIDRNVTLPNSVGAESKYFMFGAYLPAGSYVISVNGSDYVSFNRVAIAGTNCVGSSAHLRPSYTFTSAVDGWNYFSIERDAGESDYSDINFEGHDLKIMITLATDVVSMYQPYTMTNIELTQQKLSYKDNRVLGVHNLGKKLNGVTYLGLTIKDAPDGGNYINGTATSSGGRLNLRGDNFVLKAGTYTIVGESNDHSKYSTVVLQKTSDSSVLGTYEISNAGVNKSRSNFTLAADTECFLGFNTETGAAYGTDTFIIYPMVRLVDDKDDTFYPYAKTNSELTQDTKGLTDNQFENGCVNLLENKGTDRVYEGVTYTVNSDGSIRAYGTLNANTSSVFNINTSGEFSNMVGKRVKLSGCPKVTGFTTRITAYRVESVDGSSGSVFDTGDGVTFDFLNNGTGTKAQFYIEIGNHTSSPVSINTTFKPMITYADMPNSDYAHYVPYAKSNKELTEDVEDLSNAQYFDFTTETSVFANTSAQPMTHTIANDGTYRISLTSKDVDAQNGATLLINGITIGTVRADIIENNVSRILKLKKGAVITNTNSGTARYRMDVIKLS